MDYGYKITTHGRRLLAACLDLGRPLKLTRAAVGSGLIGQDEDLAEAHALVRYAAEASIADRKHEGDRLFLTVRYSNQDHPAAGSFLLSEFMVWVEDPETGQETDLLYATLGDHRQSVPGYSRHFPASVWSYPLVLVVSGELQVSITASPGLATWEDLLALKEELIRSIMKDELALPLAAGDGEPLLTSGGTPILAVYHPDRSAGILAAMEAMAGQLSAGARAYTDKEALGLIAKIAAAKAEAVSAARADAEAAVHSATEKIVYRLRWDMYQHNNGDGPETHPSFLRQSGSMILLPPKDLDHEPEV